MDSEHLGYFGVANEVLICRWRIEGAAFSSNHNIVLLLDLRLTGGRAHQGLIGAADSESLYGPHRAKHMSTLRPAIYIEIKRQDKEHAVVTDSDKKV
jgi:hypothetical protein